MKEKVLAASGLVRALGVASCCLLPLMLAFIGIGGGFVGGLTALTPYRSVFLWAAVAALTYGFYAAHVELQVSTNCASVRSSVISSNIFARTLDDLAAGRRIAMPSSRPFGCAIAYRG